MRTCSDGLGPPSYRPDYAVRARDARLTTKSVPSLIFAQFRYYGDLGADARLEAEVPGGELLPHHVRPSPQDAAARGRGPRRPRPSADADARWLLILPAFCASLLDASAKWLVLAGLRAALRGVVPLSRPRPIIAGLPRSWKHGAHVHHPRRCSNCARLAVGTGTCATSSRCNTCSSRHRADLPGLAHAHHGEFPGPTAGGTRPAGCAGSAVATGTLATSSRSSSARGDGDLPRFVIRLLGMGRLARWLAAGRLFQSWSAGRRPFSGPSFIRSARSW